MDRKQEEEFHNKSQSERLITVPFPKTIRDDSKEMMSRFLPIRARKGTRTHTDTHTHTHTHTHTLRGATSTPSRNY